MKNSNGSKTAPIYLKLLEAISKREDTNVLLSV
jgi:hypothetical protein